MATSTDRRGLLDVNMIVAAVEARYGRISADEAAGLRSVNALLRGEQVRVLRGEAVVPVVFITQHVVATAKHVLANVESLKYLGFGAEKAAAAVDEAVAEFVASGAIIDTTDRLDREVLMSSARTNKHFEIDREEVVSGPIFVESDRPDWEDEQVVLDAIRLDAAVLTYDRHFVAYADRIDRGVYVIVPTNLRCAFGALV